jgi:hypothetical protein
MLADIDASLQSYRATLTQLGNISAYTFSILQGNISVVRSWVTEIRRSIMMSAVMTCQMLCDMVAYSHKIGLEEVSKRSCYHLASSASDNPFFVL